MATQLRIKRGTTNANAPSGLTAGEMAINLVDKKLYVGGTGGTNVIFLDSTSSVGLGTANTFTQLNTFSAGISASGATFTSPIVLANSESIKNTTNGRIDFMPGPTASGAYGLYADVANWGYGVKMGTINSAGTIDSSPGGILFMDAVSIVQDKFLNIGSDGSHALVLATQNGLDTLQIAVSPGAANSQTVAITGRSDAGTTNRSPVTSHTNPNLYVYRAGTTSANDFIRIEHDGTNGNIVAGGTSGIKISGLLDVASGLSAAGATFNGTVNHQDNTLSRVEFLDYFERFIDLGDFTNKAAQIPIDLSTAQVFRTKLTAACTGLDVTNTPDNANANAVGFSLLFVGDGTARTMTWNIGNTAASWAGGTAPTYTSTLNKIDVFSFLSRDGGSTWLGFVGGQNF